MEYSEYIKRFELSASRYIPAPGNWTPSDQAVYGPSDYFRMDCGTRDELRFKAVRYQLDRHYQGNKTYRTYCEEVGFDPSSLRSAEDLDRIPVVSSDFFKTYPCGRDFALWLANLYTGELPRIHIKSKEPTHDEVIESFNSAGMAVAYSSGTSGRHTFMPRDMKSFFANEYSLAKGAVSMFFPRWDPKMRGFLLMPNPFKTNLFAGRLGTVFFDIMKDVEVALDREVTTETVRMAMSAGEGIKNKITKYVVSIGQQRSVDKIASWIDRRAKDKEKVALVGVPFMLHSVINDLKEKGKTYKLAAESVVLTGGGWKMHEDQRIPEAQFRKDVEEVLGIPSDSCLDLYGMVEGNGWMMQCPEGHHLHIPTSYLHPMVLDDKNQNVGYGKYGRFAFLDGSQGSYPGFIMTNDKVRMLEHCPYCDRPGPVLEPGITRMAGQETRGCGEEMRKMMVADAGGQ